MYPVSSTQAYYPTASTVSSVSMAESLNKGLDENRPIEELASFINKDSVNVKVDGRTALLRAVFVKNREAIRLLLQAGADPFIQNDKSGNTCFHVAAAQKDAAMLQELVELVEHANCPILYGQLEIKNRQNQTALYFAADYGNTAGFELLKKLGALPNQKCGDDNWRPLHMAASKGHVDIIKLYADSSMLVDERDGHGFTAFMVACASGHLEAAQALLDLGANHFAYTSHGMSTALHIAARYGQTHIIPLFEKFPERIDAQTQFYETPLSLAFLFGHTATASALVAIGANPNVRCGEQMDTLLQRAAILGQAEAIKVLKNSSVLVDDPTESGATAFQFACLFGKLDAARELLALGANKEIRTSSQQTPLHIAAYEGHVDIIDLFPNDPALLDAVDINGATALHIASYFGHRSFVRALLNRGASLQTLPDATYSVAVLHVYQTSQLQKIDRCCELLAKDDPQVEDAAIGCLIDQVILENLGDMFKVGCRKRCADLIAYLIERQLKRLGAIEQKVNSVEQKEISTHLARHRDLLLSLKNGKKKLLQLYLSSIQLKNALPFVDGELLASVQALHQLDSLVFIKFSRALVTKKNLTTRPSQPPLLPLLPSSQEEFDNMSVYDLLTGLYGQTSQEIDAKNYVKVGLLRGCDLRLIGVDYSLYQSDQIALSRALEARKAALALWRTHVPSYDNVITEVLEMFDEMQKSFTESDSVTLLEARFASLSVDPMPSKEEQIKQLDQTSALLLIDIFITEKYFSMAEHLLATHSSSISEYVQTTNDKNFSPYAISSLSGFEDY